jgi:hypothetical protein
MSITIDNNTLVQLLVRRGLDIDRKSIVLTEGELGYTTDTKRLFVGDSITYGGTPVGTKFLSNAATIQSLSTTAALGDITFDPILNNVYMFTASGFQPAGPIIYYGAGFADNDASFTINLDSNFWSVTGNSIVIGKLSATEVPVIDNSDNLNINGTLSINSLSTVNILLSANPTQSILRTGLRHQYDPADKDQFDLVIRGSTYVDGMLSAYSGNFSNQTTTVTVASTLSSYTESYITLPNLGINSNGRSTLDATPFVNIQYSTTPGVWLPALYMTAKPFIGFHTDGTNIDTSTYRFAVSAASSLFTGNLVVSGDVISNFTPSDINLKTNIEVIPDALSKVLKLDGITFDWKDGVSHSGKSIGVIAQQVESILPEAVHTRTDGYKGVDYIKIIPVLIEAIKELSKKVK